MDMITGQVIPLFFLPIYHGEVKWGRGRWRGKKTTWEKSQFLKNEPCSELPDLVLPGLRT